MSSTLKPSRRQARTSTRFNVSQNSPRTSLDRLSAHPSSVCGIAEILFELEAVGQEFELWSQRLPAVQHRIDQGLAGDLDKLGRKFVEQGRFILLALLLSYQALSIRADEWEVWCFREAAQRGPGVRQRD